MNKFHGTIGFVIQEETSPGVWVNNTTEKKYYGDVLRFSRRWQTSDNVNDNVVIDKQISIVADPYAIANFGFIRYVELGGIKWKVTSVEPNSPRLLLSIGEIYNG